MKKQVLVVDDDLNICREIKDALQDETTDVQYTLSAEKILPEYMRQPFCIVIMDIPITNINGIALLENMRLAKPIPILVLSPVSNTAERIKLLQAGTTTVLEKPCDIEECLTNAQSLIRTNNVIERLNREIRRRTWVVGTFPDGNSALMLVCARLRHVADTQWGNKKYMNIKHLEAVSDDASTAG